MFFFYKYFLLMFINNQFNFKKYTYLYSKILLNFKYYFFSYVSRLKIINKLYFFNNNVYLNHLYFLSLISFKPFFKQQDLIRWVLDLFQLLEEKNFIFFFRFLQKIFLNLSIAKHTQFILTLKLFFKTLNFVDLLPLKTKGFFIKFKGKIGFTGNLRKRHIFWYCNYLTKSNNCLNFLSKRELIITKSGIFNIHILVSL